MSLTTEIEMQRRLTPYMKEVVKNEVIKLLDNGIIYPISDSKWVSPTQVVPKKSGVTVITNEKNKLIPTRTITGWRMCIEYRKLNSMTRKDHFPLPFMDQILERVAGYEFYCFLDGYSGYKCGGHFSSRKTIVKIKQSGFYWPTMFKDSHAFCKTCENCQKLGSISKRHMMPLNPIPVYKD
jgi:hypothetical protein